MLFFKVLGVLESKRISYEVLESVKRSKRYDKVLNRYFVIKQKAYEYLKKDKLIEEIIEKLEGKNYLELLDILRSLK